MATCNMNLNSRYIIGLLTHDYNSIIQDKKEIVINESYDTTEQLPRLFTTVYIPPQGIPHKFC